MPTFSGFQTRKSACEHSGVFLLALGSPKILDAASLLKQAIFMADPVYNFCENPEPLIATAARLFAAEGAAREVTILAIAKPTISQTDYSSNFNRDVCIYTVYLQLPVRLYAQIQNMRDQCEQRIKEKLNEVIRPSHEDYIDSVYI